MLREVSSPLITTDGAYCAQRQSGLRFVGWHAIWNREIPRGSAAADNRIAVNDWITLKWCSAWAGGHSGEATLSLWSFQIRPGIARAAPRIPSISTSAPSDGDRSGAC